MRLGIDLDGVVADFNAGWTDRYNRDFGADLSVDSVVSWNGMVRLTHFADMDEFWEWAKDHGGHSLFRHLGTYPGALEALDELDRAGHRIVILTTKPRWAIPDTFAWLADKRIPTREVHMLYRKWRVACDVYLDDAPHQVEQIHEARPEATVCRFVRAWNDPVPGTRDITEWEDFVSLVSQLETNGPNRR